MTSGSICRWRCGSRYMSIGSPGARCDMKNVAVTIPSTSGTDSSRRLTMYLSMQSLDMVGSA